MGAIRGVALGAALALVTLAMGGSPAHAEEERPLAPPVVKRRAASETDGLAKRLLTAPASEVETLARALAGMTLPELRTVLRDLRRVAALREDPVKAPDQAPATPEVHVERERPVVPRFPPDGTSIVTLETRLLEVPVDELQDLVGGTLPDEGTSTRFLGAKAVAALLAQLERSATARVLYAPRLAAIDGQRADISVLNQVSYVQDYEVKTHGTQAVGDPVIGVVHEGFQLDLVPVVSADRKQVTVDVRCTFSELARPIKTMDVELLAPAPEGAEPDATPPAHTPLIVKIQLPELVLQELGASVTLPPGASVLLGGDAPVERDGVAVVRLILLSATGITRMDPALREGLDDAGAIPGVGGRRGR